MARGVAVGVFFVINVNTKVQITLTQCGVDMEARISGARQCTDKAHFAVWRGVLERIAGASQRRRRVGGNVGDDEFHDTVTLSADRVLLNVVFFLERVVVVVAAFVNALFGERAQHSEVVVFERDGAFGKIGNSIFFRVFNDFCQ